jgi:predicted esterase
MKALKLTLILLVVSITTMNAQKLIAMRNAVPGSYNFWFYEPETKTDSTKKPLVIFLHGRSLSGTDLQRVRRYGTIAAIEMGLKIDAFVVAPQTNNGWNAQKLWKMVEWSTKKYPIDTNRIYVLGMSMGGYGSIDLAAAYPDKIAAAIGLCGGSTSKKLCGLNKLPLWIMHGTADKDVPVRCSDNVVAAMKACGDTSRLRYDRLSGQNHSILARVFYMYEAYDWLFSHKLTDEGRPINKEHKITVPMLGNAYKHLHGKKRPNIKIVNGSSSSSSSSTSSKETTSTKTSSTNKSTSSQAKVHIVKSGDTLYALALKHKTTVSKICQLNGISEKSILKIGQKIKLP